MKNIHQALSISTARLIALCCAISVANVYYAQPLLDAMAADTGLSRAAAGGLITTTQLGSVIALLVLVPLGDLLNRRRLLLAQSMLLIAALAGVTMAHSPSALLIALACTGLLGTAMTQGLIAHAATLAHATQRGRMVGTAQAGVVIGLLMARALAGALSDIAGWRAVYAASALVCGLMGLWLWWRLPETDAARPAPEAPRWTYPELLRSMACLLMHDRTLQVRGTIGLLMFFTFAAFWSAIALPLGQPPHAWSHTAIGALGLVGVAGALAAGRAGAWTDRQHGQRVTGAALLCLMLSWGPLAMMEHSLAALLIGVLLLDLGVQALHVVNQSLILQGDPQAQGRLIACYMLFYAAGSGLGAITATWLYDLHGWAGVCALGLGGNAVASVFWWLTRPSIAVHNGQPSGNPDTPSHRIAP